MSSLIDNADARWFRFLSRWSLLEIPLLIVAFFAVAWVFWRRAPAIAHDDGGKGTQRSVIP